MLCEECKFTSVFAKNYYKLYLVIQAHKKMEIKVSQLRHTGLKPELTGYQSVREQLLKES